MRLSLDVVQLCLQVPGSGRSVRCVVRGDRLEAAATYRHACKWDGSQGSVLCSRLGGSSFFSGECNRQQVKCRYVIDVASSVVLFLFFFFIMGIDARPTQIGALH